MTDVKQLPENLEQLEQLTEFKRVYKKYNVGQLEDLLTEAKVDYLSADLKPDLVWRLLDHRGFDFEAAIAEANNDSSAPQDEPTDKQPVPADDQDDANEDVQTIQDDANGEHGDRSQIDSEGNADLSSGSASTDDSEKPNELVDDTNDDAPSDISNSDDSRANEVEQPAEAADQPTTDSSAPDGEAPLTKTVEQEKSPEPTNEPAPEPVELMPIDEPVKEKDHVAVFNNGAFPFFETATSTLVPAKKTTKIYPTSMADKGQIMRNIKQYNHTRGNKLRVVN